MKNLTRQNPEQLFVAQELINKVKSKCCGIKENEDTYNVGWHFNKRFEGKGLAREAVIGLLDYLFREAGARRIYGFVEDDNIRSKRLCERLGMRREGCFKEFVTFINNPNGTPKYEDTRVYSILKKEWNSISAKSITNN